jgi:DNA-binding transcriptional regulator YiaG
MKTRIAVIIEKKAHNNKSEFARTIKVSTENVGDWLRGVSQPGARARIAICKVYNISREWLDSGIGEMICAITTL